MVTMERRPFTILIVWYAVPCSLRSLHSTGCWLLNYWHGINERAIGAFLLGLCTFVANLLSVKLAPDFPVILRIITTYLRQY
jgi:hypothetical protein